MLDLYHGADWRGVVVFDMEQEEEEGREELLQSRV